MSFEVKKHSKSEFYVEFCLWLTSHGFPLVHVEVLPEEVFVAYNSEGKSVYCTWFYKTDSKLAWIAFPASNTEVPFTEREKGLDYLIKHICAYAKEIGFRTVFTTSGTKSVKNSLKENKFEIGDSNVDHFFKLL